MLRTLLTGSLITGITAALAGYIWVGFEFPFAIVLPAALGLLAVTWPLYGARRSLTAAAVGGVSFTVAFLVAVFLAITDGSPVAPPAYAGAVVAAAIAGAITGFVLEGRRGVVPVGGFSAIGMVAGVLVAAAMRAVAPAGVDVAGATQTAYFAAVIGLIGVVMGAAFGVGVYRSHQR